jgi:Glycosyltransferase sugar-binding region containing DXD motif
MTRARRDFHFIFGLKPQTEPFHLAFYLALESCRCVNDPDAIHFYYRNEPYGEYWDRIKPHLKLHKLTTQRQLDESRYQATQDGRFILHYGLQYAHEADVLRLEILRDVGGCYADMDTLFVQRYPDELFAHEFAIAEENAVLDCLRDRTPRSLTRGSPTFRRALMAPGLPIHARRQRVSPAIHLIAFRCCRAAGFFDSAHRHNR